MIVILRQQADRAVGPDVRVELGVNKMDEL
jgi:hypothetical protein